MGGTELLNGSVVYPMAEARMCVATLATKADNYRAYVHMTDTDLDLDTGWVKGVLVVSVTHLLLAGGQQVIKLPLEERYAQPRDFTAGMRAAEDFLREQGLL
jgi:hypothetical protein